MDPTYLFTYERFTTTNLRGKLADLTRMLQHYDTRLEEQREFFESGGHISLLSRAFGNVKSQGLPVTLGLYDDAGNLGSQVIFRKGYGFDELYGSLMLGFYKGESISPDQAFGWEVDPSRTFGFLKDATSRSSYLLQSLELDETVFGYCDNVTMGAIRNQLYANVHRMIAFPSEDGVWELRPDMNISLKYWNSSADCIEYSIETNKSRHELRSWQPGNHNAYTTFESYGMPHYLSLTAPLVRVMCREMRMENLRTDLDVLTDILKRHLSTLETLELSGLVVDITGSGAKFVDLLVEDMSLEYVRWEKSSGTVETVRDDEQEETPVFFEAQDLRGKDKIRAGLELLIPEIHRVERDYDDDDDDDDDDDNGEYYEWYSMSLPSNMVLRFRQAE